MKISLNWLKDYIETDISIDKISEVLTEIGLEVEGVEDYNFPKNSLENFVVGKVKSASKHPNADRLKLTEVDTGDGVKSIVCGAPNVDAGQTVIVAKLGAKVHLPTGESFKIKESKIRGEVSCGMICAEDELGVGGGHDGILILDSKYEAGTPASEIFGSYSDTVIEIGLTPNRSDAMGHYGVARDLAAGLKARGHKCKFNGLKTMDFNPKNKAEFKLEIETENAPIFTISEVKNINNTQSSDMIKHRLRAIGVNPKNLIVDTTNYILHDLAQPLHSYDADRLGDKVISVNQSNDKKSFLALNDNKYDVSKNDISIWNNYKCIGIAGVIGSKDSSVAEDTKNIVLESAYFQPNAVRVTSQRLGLKTDAATKFEKGIDPTLQEYAIKKAVSIIGKNSSGVEYSDIVSYNIFHETQYSVSLSKKKLTTYLGNEIDDQEVDDILSSLDIEVASYKNGVWTLKVPKYRYDVTRDVDVIEEILRIYGFNKIPYPKHLNSNISFTNKDDSSKFESKIKEILIGEGYSEISTSSIANSKYFPKESTIKLLNSMSSDLDCMRQMMLPSLLEVVDYNVRRDNVDLQLFEIGKVYSQIDGKYSESKKLSVIAIGNGEKENWLNTKGSSATLFSIKKVWEKLGLTFDIDAEIVSNENDKVDIIVDGGTLGEISMVDSQKFGFEILKEREVFYLELDIDKMYDLSGNNKILYTPISKFPAIHRDLALVVDEDISYEKIKQVSQKATKNLLVSMNIFDVYRGDNVGETKKSYALRYTLQDKEKTMTDSQIDALMNDLIVSLKEECGAILRG